MSRKGKKKNREQIVKYESSNISQEKMIEIQAEAYYRALKRLEDEKNKENEKVPEKKKYKWYENALFVLNVLFWPWKINKAFSVSNRIYDSILVLFVSGAMQFIGGIMWLAGTCTVVFEIYKLITSGLTEEMINISPIMVFMIFLGSAFVLAGGEFGKETDSNKIYAYSASIIALISCIVGAVALM